MKLPKSERVQTWLSYIGVILAVLIFYGVPPVMARTLTDHPTPVTAKDSSETIQGDASTPVLPIPAGTVGIVLRSSLVVIKNPGGTNAGTGVYKKALDFDQKCLVENSEKITAVAERTNVILVRYYRSWRSGDFPDVCENGTLFWISADEFRKLRSAIYSGKTVEQELEINEIQRIISPRTR